MPVIRGACLRKNQDLWWLETINIKVGIIKVINEAAQTITVKTNEGDRIINPKDMLIFSSPTNKITPG